MSTPPAPDTWWSQFVSGWANVLSALRPRRALPPPPSLDAAPPFAPEADLRIFVTVGSTRFDELIEAVLAPLLYESLDAAADREGDEDAACGGGGGGGGPRGVRPDLPAPRFRHVHLLIQYGASDLPSILSMGATGPSGSLPFTLSGPPEGSLLHGQVKAEISGPTAIEVTLFRFAPSLDSCVRAADLVISHCGSGTLLETLRAPASAAQRAGPWQRQILAVSNRALMDDHQAQLAHALVHHPDGPFIHMAEAHDLPYMVHRVLVLSRSHPNQTPLAPFPAWNAAPLVALMDEEAGFPK